MRGEQPLLFGQVSGSREWVTQSDDGVLQSSPCSRRGGWVGWQVVNGSSMYFCWQVVNGSFLYFFIGSSTNPWRCTTSYFSPPPPHTHPTHTRRYLHPPQTGVAASGHLRERLWIRLGLRYGPCRRSHRFLVPLPCTDPHVPRRKGGRRKTLIVDVVVRQRSHT